MIIAGLLLLLNTSIGTYWFSELRNAEEKIEFTLTNGYLAQLIIMLVFSWLIFLILLLLLVKVICFFLT